MESIRRNDVSASDLRNKMPDGCRAVGMLHIVQEAALIMKEIRKVASVPLTDRIDKFTERVDRVVPNLMNGGCDALRSQKV